MSKWVMGQQVGVDWGVSQSTAFVGTFTGPIVYVFPGQTVADTN
jgi:hypothetical protein